MKLPQAGIEDGIVKRTLVQFGGMNHTLAAADGELFEMMNLGSDHYPAMSTRADRMLLTAVENPAGLFSWDGLAWVSGRQFYYAGRARGQLPTGGSKTFAALGDYIVIWPDKAYYNTKTDAFGLIESAWSGQGLTFCDGLLYGEAAQANTIRCEGVQWTQYFREGDCITVAGCTTHPENNKQAIIRQIDGDRLYFYEFGWVLDGEEQDQAYTEPGAVRLSRDAPDLLYLCENENRLWGCDSSTIYASKLGDIFNWNVFDGLSTDSYSVDTGSAGPFTGCISYLGYPTFFKEEYIYKVYGQIPSNFQLMHTATIGVAEGSGQSLAIAGETLFYLSRVGVMSYNGGIPMPIGSAFGTQRFTDGVAGSDGLKYYIAMRGSEDGNYHLHVYDTRRGMWHTEDQTQALGFALYRGNLYYMDQDGAIATTGNIQDPPPGAVAEGRFPWRAEFGDFTENSTDSQTVGPDKKGVGRLQIRLELDEGATMQVTIQYDSDGIWREAGRLSATVKRSFILPLIPRRCDHYRIRLSGTGGCRVYSISREFYAGSELRSQPGRQ